jgi:hypothetical protein
LKTRGKYVNLYQLTDALRQLADQLEDTDEGGELTDEAFITHLDQLQLAWESKVQALCEWRANLGADATRLRAIASTFQVEADRIRIQAERAEKKAAWVKNYLLTSLLHLGERKAQVGTWHLTVCRNSQPTILFDPDNLPEEYTKTVTQIGIDRDAVLRAWKNNPAAIPPSIIVQQGQHLRIT